MSPFPPRGPSVLQSELEPADALRDFSAGAEEPKWRFRFDEQMRAALYKASEIEDKKGELIVEKQYVPSRNDSYRLLLTGSPWLAAERSKTRRNGRSTGRSPTRARARARPSTRRCVRGVSTAGPGLVLTLDIPQLLDLWPAGGTNSNQLSRESTPRLIAPAEKNDRADAQRPPQSRTTSSSSRSRARSCLGHEPRGGPGDRWAVSARSLQVPSHPHSSFSPESPYFTRLHLQSFPFPNGNAKASSTSCLFSFSFWVFGSAPPLSIPLPSVCKPWPSEVQLERLRTLLAKALLLRRARRRHRRRRHRQPQVCLGTLWHTNTTFRASLCSSLRSALLCSRPSYRARTAGGRGRRGSSKNSARIRSTRSRSRPRSLPSFRSGSATGHGAAGYRRRRRQSGTRMGSRSRAPQPQRRTGRAEPCSKQSNMFGPIRSEDSAQARNLAVPRTRRFGLTPM